MRPTKERAHELQPALEPLLSVFRDAAATYGLSAPHLAAMAWRESEFLTALHDDCGDWACRAAQAAWVAVPIQVVTESPSGWAPARDRFGNKLPFPWCIPDDGLGWGRGLMQIDYAAHQDWLAANDWRDPETNLGYGCTVYLIGHAWLAHHGYSDGLLIRASIAAYNAGITAVHAAVSGGHPCDEPTTGHDYSAWVMAAATILEPYLEGI